MQQECLSNREESALVNENMFYAQSLARKFSRTQNNSVLDAGDYESAAFVGLCEAACRFDTAKGQSFQTYAYFRIRGAVYDLIRRTRVVTKVQDRSYPEWGSRKAKSDGKKKRYLFAEELNGLTYLTSILEQGGIRLHGAIHRGGFGGSGVAISYANTLSPEGELSASEMRSYLQGLIQRLPSRERRIIYRRYFKDQTFDQMKPYFKDVSRSWLSRLHLRALERLREMILEDESHCELREEAYCA